MVAVALVGATGILLAPVGSAPSAAAATIVRTDVLVYGGTPGGILAAVAAARAGARVILLEPTRHLGGMMSSGLSWTDIGDKSTLGGYTKEFFDRVQALEGSAAARYAFQPHTAEAAFKAMIHSTSVTVRYGERMTDHGGVTMDGTRLLTFLTKSGRRYAAGVFIDATYEGDLLARAGVRYRIGREAGAEYGESLAGVRPGQVAVTDPTEPRAPYVSAAPGPVGSADTRIQAANYRVCFSSDPANQVPFSPPSGYSPNDYGIFLDYLAERAASSGSTPDLSWLLTISPLAGGKFDVNDRGLLSTALPGQDWTYPLLGGRGRARVEATHRRHNQGLFYFLRNDDRVPAPIRDAMASYGLCKDEFTDNGNWPWLLYVREGRRMVGEYVLTQADITTTRGKADIIGIASYRVDAHLVSRWIDGAGRVVTEGSLSLAYQNYAIPYRALTPRREDVTNLLVPVAASASHVAQSSLRMEPQYMLMGEAAGEAASMAVRRRVAAAEPVTPLTRDQAVVQDVDVAALQARLIARGARLTNPPDGD